MSGVRKDLEQSFKYFKLSADKGNAVAQCYLGLHFLNGDGTLKNLKEAFKYIKLSADKENAEGQVWLARCYVEGFGVEINLEKAIEYYDLVAVKEGKNQDYAKQALSGYIEEYKLLANQGDASAQYLMSVLFSTKTFSNPVEAFNYCKRSADQENADAQLKLGICYEHGRGHQLI